jgi:hypothetical protein
MIAPFLTDFFPGSSADSTIEYTSDTEKLVVRWKNLALWGSSYYGYTFSVELRKSGLIRIHHEAVSVSILN